MRHTRAAKAPQPEDPVTSLRFIVGIEGVPEGRAVEVVFPESRLVTLRNRLVVQHGPLTIRRGLTSSTTWYDWWHAARKPRPDRRLVTVTLQGPDGRTRHMWLFPDSVPKAYSLSPLNALNEAVVLESLEVKVGDFVLRRLE
jgi:hypothetical protein